MMSAMENEHGSIKPLPVNVQKQIKSAISILSLNDVVLELLKNSLDACATRVDIELNYAKGYCTVKDDGIGIPSCEFQEGGRLAQLHCMDRNNLQMSY